MLPCESYAFIALAEINFVNLQNHIYSEFLFSKEQRETFWRLKYFFSFSAFIVIIFFWTYILSLTKTKQKKKSYLTNPIQLPSNFT